MTPTRYSDVSTGDALPIDVESHASFNSKESSKPLLGHVARGQSPHQWRNVVLYIGTHLAVAVITAFLVASLSRKQSDDFLLPSPIPRDVDRTPYIASFDLPFLKHNIYRQPPSPEVDAAWDDLGASLENVLVSQEDALKAGLRPEMAHLNPEYGAEYPVHVEAIHGIHCLNNLRRSLYWNYEYYRDTGIGGYNISDSRLRIHTTHCLDAIRQRLMCAADVGLVGSSWYRLYNGELRPLPDFNYPRVCRNYTEVLEWTRSRQITSNDFLSSPDDWIARPVGDEPWIKPWI
ncbi:UstYa family oxidase [Sphaerulina musiva]